MIVKSFSIHASPLGLEEISLLSFSTVSPVSFRFPFPISLYIKIAEAGIVNARQKVRYFN